MGIQRWSPSDRPEEMHRDDEGEWVLYDEALELQKALIKFVRSLRDNSSPFNRQAGVAHLSTSQYQWEQVQKHIEAN